MLISRIIVESKSFEDVSHANVIGIGIHSIWQQAIVVLMQYVSIVKSTLITLIAQKRIHLQLRLQPNETKILTLGPSKKTEPMRNCVIYAPCFAVANSILYAFQSQALVAY